MLRLVRNARKRAARTRKLTCMLAVKEKNALAKLERRKMEK